MRPKTVLIVEDDSDIQELLADLLVDEGYEVRTASNGREALDILRGEDLDSRDFLILLDWMMPVMNGRQFMEEWERDFPQWRNKIPIVIFSASVRVDGVDAARFIRKPVDVDILLKVVRELAAPKDHQ